MDAMSEPTLCHLHGIKKRLLARMDYMSAVYDANEKSYIVKVVNMNDAPVKVKINITGLKKNVNNHRWANAQSLKIIPIPSIH